MSDELSPAKVRLTDGLGPWSVSMLERPQLRPYYVCRQVSPTGWEQLHASEGGIARFETMSEAQEAADAANAARA
jgi:hypothetical protein